MLIFTCPYCGIEADETELAPGGEAHLKRFGPGSHVDIGIEFEDRDLELAGFEDGGEGRRKNAFTQRGNHPAGYANILGHEAPIS